MTSSQAGSHASPFLWPDEERERKTTATSGRTCCVRYTKSDPLGSLERTLLGSSRWFSPARRLKWEAVPLFSGKVTEKEYCSGRNMSSKPSVVTLNEKVTKSGRLLFRLVPSVRPTGETGCGLSQDLLPTSTVMEDRRKPNGNEERQKKLMSNLNPFSIQQILPTPQIQGLKINVDGKTEFMPLELLPTPTTTENHHRRRVEKLKEAGGGTLYSRANGSIRPWGLMDCMDFYGMLLTPSASDGVRANLSMENLKNHNRPNAENSNLAEQIAHKVGGGTSRLNPLFVEEMMGFPLMWTALPFLSPNGGRNP